MSAIVHERRCVGCGLTDNAPDPKLSGVQPDPVSGELICGTCFGKRFPATLERFEKRNGHKPATVAIESVGHVTQVIESGPARAPDR